MIASMISPMPKKRINAVSTEAKIMRIIPRSLRQITAIHDVITPAKAKSINIGAKTPNTLKAVLENSFRAWKDTVIEIANKMTAEMIRPNPHRPILVIGKRCLLAIFFLSPIPYISQTNSELAKLPDESIDIKHSSFGEQLDSLETY